MLFKKNRSQLLTSEIEVGGKTHANSLIVLIVLLCITLQRKHVCNMTHVCKINIKGSG